MIGLGHIGLPTAVGLSELGWKVTGLELDHKKVSAILTGTSPFFEPGLTKALKKQLETGNFTVTSEYSQAIPDADVVFVCVDTPTQKDGWTDMSNVESAAKMVAKNIVNPVLVVEKSTAPVRTANKIYETMTKHCPPGALFDVATNPEFLREGRALEDFRHPDRIVIGVQTDRARKILTEIYSSLLNPNESDLKPQFFVTDLNTSELIKHAANAFLSTKISFINVVANICEKTGADVKDVAEAIGSDPRIGRAFLDAGIGYGGYCLPKDLSSFIRIGESEGVDMGMFHNVKKINDSRVDHIVDHLREKLWVLNDKTIGIWGLAFKPGTDDVRESPSIIAVKNLLEQGAHLKLFDPKANQNFRSILQPKPKEITFVSNALEAVKDCDALLVLTDWPELKNIDPLQIRNIMKNAVVFDGRNCLDSEKYRNCGFDYIGMGVH